jgi:hypothetical protein
VVEPRAALKASVRSLINRAEKAKVKLQADAGGRLESRRFADFPAPALCYYYSIQPLSHALCGSAGAVRRASVRKLS